EDGAASGRGDADQQLPLETDDAAWRCPEYESFGIDRRLRGGRTLSRVRLLRRSFRHAALSLPAGALLRAVAGDNTIATADAHNLLGTLAQAQLGGGEQAI